MSNAYCKQCKVTQVKRIGKVFCSPQCYWKSRKGASNNKWKGGSLEFTCKTCDTVFAVDRDRSDAKTCSMVCNKAYRKSEEFRMKLSKIQKELIGPREFRRSFTSLLRTCSRYAQWRERILDRDNYTCQICETRGGKLHVDHIESFLQVLKKNNVRTYEEALWCTELWDTKNGRTLCLPCHYATPNFGAKALKLLTV